MTYALVNFNNYLGGGETLLVRWSEYLYRKGYRFKSYYVAGSYIENDLRRIGIPQDYLCPIYSNINYYYLGKSDRKQLRNEICKYIEEESDVCFISFDARDMYTVYDIANKNTRFKVAHLILHAQDNLYACQTLWDKLKIKMKGNRRFSNRHMIEKNIALFNVLCGQSVVIPMCERECDLWQNDFGINVDKSKTVPLPTCDFSKVEHRVPLQNDKILWIGRVVDFKIPALCAMIDYVGNQKKYILTIVGNGEVDFLHRYISEKGYSLEQFVFLGEVKYSDLPTVIHKHSIGYACGTSIIEIGKYGLPVIMALGSPDYKLFKEQICGGLYIGISKGNVGGNLHYPGTKDKIVLIKEAINYLESDYYRLSQDCYEYLRDNFDSENNFGRYMEYLSEARSISSDVKIPSASIVRKLAFKLFK